MQQSAAAAATETEAATPLLKLEDVVTYYGSIRILKEVNLEVYPGEVV